MQYEKVIFKNKCYWEFLFRNWKRILSEWERNWKTLTKERRAICYSSEVGPSHSRNTERPKEVGPGIKRFYRKYLRNGCNSFEWKNWQYGIKNGAHRKYNRKRTREVERDPRDTKRIYRKFESRYIVFRFSYFFWKN